MDYYRSCAGRIRDLAIVTEERGDWTKGRILANPSVVFELSFEAGPKPFPTTNITYLGLWQGKRTLFEYQNNCLVKAPLEPDWQLFVKPLIERLVNYRHIVYAI